MPNPSEDTSIPTSPTSEQQANNELQLNQPVVMIVDDELQVLDIARRLIERLGYRVLAESDPQAAYARYTTEHGQISCVLLDLAMRPIDGLELFAMMRSINPQVCAILCSGYSESGSAEHYIRLGFIGFLPKPYRIDELRKVLANVLDGMVE